MGTLTDLAEEQESSEDVFGDATMELSFDTRSGDEETIVEKTYTFTHAPEWDKWLFSAYCERRCSTDDPMYNRHWTVVEDVTWDDPEAATVDIPQSVIDELDETLSIDVMRMQL